VTYEQIKPFAHAVADVLQREKTLSLVVSQMAGRALGPRANRLSQNNEHKTTVSAHPAASAWPQDLNPVAEEVEACR
jgi:hypothetical protein